MAWSIIFQSFIAAVISSAVVSSIVTFYLKDRSDLKKRKIAVYIDYLEQYRKIFPLGDTPFIKKSYMGAMGRMGTIERERIDREGFITWRNTKHAEIIKLEKCYFFILIIGGGKVAKHAKFV